MKVKQMELDLSHYRWHLIGLAALVALALLIWIGSVFTPEGEKTLTWTEWQVVKAQRAYQQELDGLQMEASNLADLLNASPDPVRAQIVAERIQRLAADGQPSLHYQREKLALAAQAVSSWAVGAGDRETAAQSLEEAIQVLSPQTVPDPTPAVTPGS
jgi:hypothetical protein